MRQGHAAGLGECTRHVTGQSSGSFRSFKSSPVSSVQARYFTCCQLSIALNVPPVLRGNSIKKDLFEGSPCVTALGKRIFNFLIASSIETLGKGSAAGITQMLTDVPAASRGISSVATSSNLAVRFSRFKLRKREQDI